jgi:hypothetical protein
MNSQDASRKSTQKSTQTLNQTSKKGYIGNLNTNEYLLDNLGERNLLLEYQMPILLLLALIVVYVTWFAKKPKVKTDKIDAHLTPAPSAHNNAMKTPKSEQMIKNHSLKGSVRPSKMRVEALNPWT